MLSLILRNGRTVQGRVARGCNPGHAPLLPNPSLVGMRARISPRTERATRTRAPATALCPPLVPGPRAPSRARRLLLRQQAAKRDAVVCLPRAAPSRAQGP